MDDVLHAELCDFGLTTVIEFADAASGNTTTISSGESVRWCSPEVLEGSRKTLESDIWAWGCLVLEVRRYFIADNILADLLTLFKFALDNDRYTAI